MTNLPPNQFESGAQAFPPEETTALDRSQGPGAVVDIPDDLKQRFLAAIEDDYRFIFDEAQFLADLYAPPDIRGDTFEQHIAKLDELIDEQPMPIFMQRTA